ncbi:MAG: hypothetical protein PVG41_01420 [Desulfobacteraceae bacterium]
MNNKLNPSDKKPTKIAQIINIILLIFNLVAAMGVISLKFSRATYIEISNQIFSPGTPLMDSILLDLLLRKSCAVFIVIFAVIVVLKEKRIKTMYNRIRMNIAALACIMMYTFLLLYLVYKPVIGPA